MGLGFKYSLAFRGLGFRVFRVLGFRFRFLGFRV
jgi:hypothetical protein